MAMPVVLTGWPVNGRRSEASRRWFARLTVGGMGGAGPMRNRQMLDEKPDLVVAFAGGSGTRNMIDIARRAGVKVIVVEKPLRELQRRS